MIIDDEYLKYNSQYPKSIHILAILMIFFKQSIYLTTLRYFHEELSRLRVDKLLHLLMALVNSSFEKGGQINDSFNRILFKMFILI